MVMKRVAASTLNAFSSTSVYSLSSSSLLARVLHMGEVVVNEWLFFLYLVIGGFSDMDTIYASPDDFKNLMNEEKREGFICWSSLSIDAMRLRLIARHGLGRVTLKK